MATTTLTDPSATDTAVLTGPRTQQQAVLTRPGLEILEVGGLAGLAATAWIHIAEFGGKFAEVPYLGVGYILLSMACAVSIVMVLRHRIEGWYLGGATAAATLIGYVLTRTTGLPGSLEDIGNWSEPIAIYSLIAEILVIGVSAAVYLHAREKWAPAQPR